MNYLDTFQKADIPSSFLRLYLFSQTKNNNFTPQKLLFRDNFLFVRRECGVFDVRLVRDFQMKISGQARSSVITGGTRCEFCNRVTIRYTLQT